MTPLDPRYAHWQQSPDEELNDCPGPAVGPVILGVVILETSPRLEGQDCRTLEEDPCLEP
jgi:hypothetical protein